MPILNYSPVKWIWIYIYSSRSFYEYSAKNAYNEFTILLLHNIILVIEKEFRDIKMLKTTTVKELLTMHVCACSY